MIWVEERMGDMKYVAGVDIGNATTEVALAKIEGTDLTFLASGIGTYNRNQRNFAEYQRSFHVFKECS